MAKPVKKIICPSCGFANSAPLANSRCASCGAKVEDVKRSLTREEELERRYQQESFSITWFMVSIAIMLVTTAAFVMGLPMVIPALDFEGSAGMMVNYLYRLDEVEENHEVVLCPVPFGEAESGHALTLGVPAHTGVTVEPRLLTPRASCPGCAAGSR